jgi:hypothetical protein
VREKNSIIYRRYFGIPLSCLKIDFTSLKIKMKREENREMLIH